MVVDTPTRPTRGCSSSCETRSPISHSRHCRTRSSRASREERLSKRARGCHRRWMRRLELALLLLVAVLAVTVLLSRRGEGPPPSPYCRAGPPLAGVYHPSRLHVRRRCAVAVGVVTKVKFEEFDGDIHIDLRVDDRRLLSDGNDKVGGALVVEIVPQD